MADLSDVDPDAVEIAVDALRDRVRLAVEAAQRSRS